MTVTVAIPPFEQLYTTHGAEVLAYLRRIAGEAAEDAFQETFLRALRAYPGLESGEHLRAWLFTIATRVAFDGSRRARRERPAGDRGRAGTLLEIPVDPSRPAHAEIEHLTAALPPTERAAVVLRYAYDLPYAEIAAALGSSEAAARQAASSGVRRLRERRTP